MNERSRPLEFTAPAPRNIRHDGTLRAPGHDLSKSLSANERWHLDSTDVPVMAAGAVFTALRPLVDVHRATARPNLLTGQHREAAGSRGHDPGRPRRMWHTRIAGDPATESGIDR